MSERPLEETLDARRAEIALKLEATRGVMARCGVDALYLTTIANTAWLTAGAATYVNESVDEAALSMLVTMRDAYILTDPIEEPRLRDEEQLERLGFTFIVEPWHARGPVLARLTSNKHLASDQAGGNASDAIRQELVRLRATLMVGEQARMRAGARLAAAAMREIALAVQPGMTEQEVAANLMAASRKRGGTAIVTLVGSDERIFRYRHPLPTAKTIERFAMLILCFRYRGLVAALTRSVYIGAPPDSLRATAQAVARVDARMISGTQPGRSLAEMFALARQAYADEGQPDAIEQHHQGGPIAYLAREALATPECPWRIEPGQAFAWNPSLRGAKSEDTILLTDDGAEVLTLVDEWPVWRVETSAGMIERPAILTLPE
jgi:Xaa-Pro aminopeptidase